MEVLVNVWHRTILGLLLGMFFLALPSQALASGKGESHEKTRVEITAVSIDLQNEYLYIHGRGFSSGHKLEVVLQESELTVLESSDSLVTVALPAEIGDGDFRLYLSTGHGKRHRDSYDLTIQHTALPVFAGQECTPGTFVIGFDSQGNILCSSGAQVEVEGVWFVHTGEEMSPGVPVVIYLVAGPSGQLTDVGGIHNGPNAGSWAVESATSFSLNIVNTMNSDSFTVTCDVDLASYEGSCSAPFLSQPLPIWKVQNTSLCEGTQLGGHWQGQLTDAITQQVRLANFNVGAEGLVDFVSGDLASPVSGRFFCDKGTAVGLLRTGETDDYSEIRIVGTVTTGTINASYTTDSGAAVNDGEMLLIAQ